MIGSIRSFGVCKREDITSPRKGDTLLSSWRECAEVLLETFFPGVGGRGTSSARGTRRHLR